MTPFIGETGQAVTETRSNVPGDLFWCQVDWKDAKINNTVTQLAESISTTRTVGVFAEQLSPGTSVEITKPSTSYNIKITIDKSDGINEIMTFSFPVYRLDETVARDIFALCALDITTLNKIAMEHRMKLLIEDPSISADKEKGIGGNEIYFTAPNGGNDFQGRSAGRVQVLPYIPESGQPLTVIVCEQNPNTSMFSQQAIA